MDVCGSRQPRTTCPTLLIFAIAHLHELQDGREDTRAAQERQACALWSVSQARRKAENVGWLVGMADAEHRGFVEWPAENLYAKRQTVGAEAVADLQRWLAGDV